MYTFVYINIDQKAVYMGALNLTCPRGAESMVRKGRLDVTYHF